MSTERPRTGRDVPAARGVTSQQGHGAAPARWLVVGALALGGCAAILEPTPIALLWTAVGALIALAGHARHRTSPRCDDLQRHLAAARRRDVRMAMCVYTVAAPPPRRQQIAADCFRWTDSVVVRRVGQQLEVMALMEAAELDPSALERRIAECVGVAPRFAWAFFPEHGATVEALRQTALAGIRAHGAALPHAANGGAHLLPQHHAGPAAESSRSDARVAVPSRSMESTR